MKQKYTREMEEEKLKQMVDYAFSMSNETSFVRFLCFLTTNGFFGDLDVANNYDFLEENSTEEGITLKCTLDYGKTMYVTLEMENGNPCAFIDSVSCDNKLRFIRCYFPITDTVYDELMAHLKLIMNLKTVYSKTWFDVKYIRILDKVYGIGE